MPKVDYLIIGQGFGGTFLAHELLKRNKTFLLIDEVQQNASEIAAGVYNPVVLKRFAPIWNAEKQIQFFEKIISELEKLLSISLLNKQEVVRIFHDEEEQQIWLNKAEIEKVKPFLETTFRASYPNIHSPNKTAKVKMSGRIDAHLFIHTFRKFLIEKGNFREEKFKYEDLKVEENHIQYKDIEAGNIIFSDGKGVLQNPFFSYLPIQLNKGECLQVKLSEPIEDQIFKKKSFLFSMKNNVHYVGGSYSLTELSESPTEKIKQDLIKDTQEIYTQEFSVEDHHYGYRPVTRDRRPMIGTHPRHKNIHLLNGLGTRGTLLGCYFAHQLMEKLEHQVPIDKEADLERYEKYFQEE